MVIFGQVKTIASATTDKLLATFHWRDRTTCVIMTNGKGEANDTAF